MPEQALGGHDHQRAWQLGEQSRLAAQQVKVLRRRGAVGDAHVALGRLLQEALQAGARMLRSLTLVAVGEKQHQRWLLSPLGTGRENELVQHDLRAVDKVAVLRLPK